MSKNTKTIIKRVTPPQPKNKRFDLQGILKAAQKVREAMEKEEKQYGKLGLA
jgi:hypothetical protein